MSFLLNYYYFLMMYALFNFNLRFVLVCIVTWNEKIKYKVFSQLFRFFHFWDCISSWFQANNGHINYQSRSTYQLSWDINGEAIFLNLPLYCNYCISVHFWQNISPVQARYPGTQTNEVQNFIGPKSPNRYRAGIFGGIARYLPDIGPILFVSWVTWMIN